jgi:hypothetical protein
LAATSNSQDTFMVRGTLGAGNNLFMGGGYTGAKMFVEANNDRDPKPTSAGPSARERRCRSANGSLGRLLASQAIQSSLKLCGSFDGIICEAARTRSCPERSALTACPLVAFDIACVHPIALRLS